MFTIKDEIYDYMETHEELLIGHYIYKPELAENIIDLLKNRGIEEYMLVSSPWPYIKGGTNALSWIENGHLQMMTWDYRMEED